MVVVVALVVIASIFVEIVVLSVILLRLLPVIPVSLSVPVAAKTFPIIIIGVSLLLMRSIALGIILPAKAARLCVISVC